MRDLHGGYSSPFGRYLVFMNGVATIPYPQRFGSYLTFFPYTQVQLLLFIHPLLLLFVGFCFLYALFSCIITKTFIKRMVNNVSDGIAWHGMYKAHEIVTNSNFCTTF
ncbi:hypothetical protein CsSME_00043288 [Camellia sinensis var. sinensis]